MYEDLPNPIRLAGAPGRHSLESWIFVFDKLTCACLLYLRYEINSCMNRLAQSRALSWGMQRQ
jgi:hypothetical protein